MRPGRYKKIKSKHFGYSESCVSIADSVPRGYTGDDVEEKLVRKRGVIK